MINGGSENCVENCVLDDIGSTALNITGGDSKTLTGSGDVVSDTQDFPASDAKCLLINPVFA